jgi:hypothetical protein
MVHWSSYLYKHPSWIDILAYCTDGFTDITVDLWCLGQEEADVQFCNEAFRKRDRCSNAGGGRLVEQGTRRVQKLGSCRVGWRPELLFNCL